MVKLIGEEDSYFYQNDCLESPVRLLDKEGKTAASYQYEEFGKRIDQTILQKEQLFGFVGYERGKETKFYQYVKKITLPAVRKEV